MKLHQRVLCLLFAVTASTASADQLKTDDTLVQGNLCIGTDCISGEDFSSGTVKLKENNTRIRWYDTSAASGESIRQHFENTYIDGVVGRSWRADANQSANGGANAFYVSQHSTQDYPVLSDGNAPDYDCTSLPITSSGTIPAGQPAETDTGCLPYRSFIQRDTLVMGGAETAGVVLGLGSALADGEVSIGNAEMKRRLVHVAAAVAETDILIKEQLDKGLLLAEKTRLDEIEALMNMAEKELVVLEDAVAPKRKGGGGAAGWLLVLLPLVAMVRRRRSGLN